MPEEPKNITKKVICTCFSYGCRLDFYINEFGEPRPGRWVSKTTRYNHCIKEGSQQAQSNNDSAFNSNDIPENTLPSPTSNIQHPKSTLTYAEEVSEDISLNGIFLDDINETIRTVADARAAIYYMACVLGSWLHIVFGLSRSSTNVALRMVQLIISLSVTLGRLALANDLASPNESKTHNDDATARVPHDIRTASSKLLIDPLIRRTVCCPKCFCNYALDAIPNKCTYRETPRSWRCNEPLLRVVRHPNQGAKVIPRRLYSTQDFPSWLEHFLSQPGVEDLIDKSYEHQPRSPEVGMQSIWDSPAWQSIKTEDAEGNTYIFSHGRNNLIFSYFIDWFNPHLNKIAGLMSSCGAIMFFCLNLPYEFQHLARHTYFAGITPPPKEPTITTITALSDPIVDQFLQAWDGIVVRTHRHPNGITKRSAILPVIGDLLGIRKCMGYAAPTAHNFCSFCWLKLFDIGNFDTATWRAKHGSDMRHKAEMWRAATTKTERGVLFQQNGVRWSSLQRLPYRDPVQHTVLGVMHNWIEGVVQHHVRYKWGIGIPDGKDSTTKSKPQPAGNRDTPQDLPQNVMQVDSDPELEAEPGMLTPTQLNPTAQQSNNTMGELSYLQERLGVLENAARERSYHTHGSSSSSGTTSSEDSNNSDSDSDRSGAESPLHYPVSLNSGGVSDTESNPDSSISEASDRTEGADTSAEDDEPTLSDTSHSTFSKESISQIRQGLSQVSIPSWLGRPPTNLGEKSHGKLKADEWLVLATVFFPLIIPELLNNIDDETSHQLLDNFYHLSACTNIITAHTVTTGDADLYLDHYLKYMDSSKELFPHLSIRPNHHLAVHSADQMKFWGPLMKVSEYPYERHNGLLQRIKTNGHPWDLDFTMLRKACQIGRLQSMAQSPNAPAPASENVGTSSPSYTGMMNAIQQVASRILFPSTGYAGPASKSSIPLHGMSESISESDSSHLHTNGRPLSKAKILSDEIYNSMFLHANTYLCPAKQLPPFRHYLDFPHPLNANVFPRRAWPINHLQHNGRTYTNQTGHEGNSSVSFLNPRNNHIDAGFIQSIWQLALPMHNCTFHFLVISPHFPLIGGDIQRNPYLNMPDLLTTVVYTQAVPSAMHVVIEAGHLQAHVPFYRRPGGTFGIGNPVTIIVNSLYRKLD